MKSMAITLLGCFGLMFGGCAHVTPLPVCHGPASPINAPLTVPAHD
jgi:hypothetical protein